MAGKGGRGRTPKAGKRNKAGRLITPHDYGNDRVVAFRAAYLSEGGIKASDDLFCAIGQAHAAGLLEGTRFGGRALMEHGREWHRLVRSVYGGAVTTSNMEKIGRSRPSLEDVRTDFRYESWHDIVERLPAGERHTLNIVCVHYGETWDLPPFLIRLLNEWRLKKGLQLMNYDGSPGSGVLPTRADREQLERLKSALLAVVTGTQKRSAA
ncbi:MAG: hypothetical protein M3N39_04440 [Pseudomonadota bacterium]|nr:hypothetical protein [Pseudomonadota bacterium]